MRKWPLFAGGGPFPFLAALFLILRLIGELRAQQEERRDDGDELFILLDEISVFSCRGVKNEIRLTEEVCTILGYALFSNWPRMCKL